MASGPCRAALFVLYLNLLPVLGAWDCKSYRDITNVYHPTLKCSSFCCGSCNNRYCCSEFFYRLSDDKQDDCFESDFDNSNVTIGSILGGVAVMVLIFISCCICPCCCIYKMCRKPQPVVATTHTTVVTTTPTRYPQQPTAGPGQPQNYQGAQYPGYQPVPINPGYGSQPMPQGYGGQSMPPAPYQGQPYAPGPPPPYHEAAGPGYAAAPMPYSQAAFMPGHPAYPLQPPAQPQPNAPPPQADFHGQPAYNPDYAPKA